MAIGRLGTGFGRMGASSAAATAATYTANGVIFDGTNDFLSRGAALTGAADGKVGLCSFWFWMQGGDGATNIFTTIQIAGAGTRFAIFRNTGNIIFVQGRNAAGANILILNSTSTHTASMSGYAHVLTSWDLAAARGQIYVDGVDVLAGGPTITNDTIAYNTSIVDASIGADTAGASKGNYYLADFYLNTAETLDISVQGNRDKFRSATGHPVNLGSNGSTPTGTAPIMFFHGAAASFNTNLGTGNGFTVTGALTDAPSNP